MPASPWDGPPHWDGRPERFRPSPTFTLLAPVVVCLLVQVPAAIGIAAWLHVGWAAGLGQVALAAAGPLALLGSRRAPGPTVAVVSALALVDLLSGPDVGPPYLALAFAIVLAVARGALVWAVVSVVAAWVAALSLGSTLGVSWHPFRIALTTALLAACFGIGAFVRVRRERAAAYRAEAVRRRRTAEERERVRIARELHDVIGHALSQINVQASVGLHLMERDPGQARTALEHIKTTSKTALEEVRSVLGVIRGDADAPLAPLAELAELPRLAEGLRSPGFEVELVDRIEDPPGRAVQFAAYRIAQEALTNVVRHAGATKAAVTVQRLGDELRLTVDDDGHGLQGAEEGSGILGMRERAALLGGSVELDRSPRGGTRLTARLPWGATA
ncbi:signal transduction histidine kinase [Agromyces flavus]|uniref:histidine kinase n=1 Tax=Agromyces flavus TaxID=589382 RepID=A0A1H1TV37_9MICO|nr:sensor histidine kinase [Agromyces flavus]MCP2368360.1 signal transduction histidine kinase [Agromyces flavus]GGI47822.1 two-component sensor histidine kinase [Agromyces flavus]SDS63489.1 Signal transduction histidine kinase [Agromyces flavus]